MSERFPKKESLALAHSIQLEKLVKKIKNLETLIDAQAQTNDEFHLRITTLENELVKVKLVADNIRDFCDRVEEEDKQYSKVRSKI